MKEIGGASVEVTSSLSLGVKELLRKVLEMFVPESLEGVGNANRSAREWLGYSSKLECWLVLVDVVLHEDLGESRTPAAGRYIESDCKVLFSFASLLDESVKALNNGEEVT